MCDVYLVLEPLKFGFYIGDDKLEYCRPIGPTFAIPSAKRPDCSSLSEIASSKLDSVTPTRRTPIFGG
jgi:hypothetical protein